MPMHIVAYHGVFKASMWFGQRRRRESLRIREGGNEMKPTRMSRMIGPLLTGVLVVAACTSGATATPSPQASAAPPSGSAELPSAAPTEMPGTKEFTVAFTSLGMSSAPFLAALASLREQGYTIETPVLAESELVTQGTASGEFAFGSGANNSTLTAIEAGAKLKVLVNRVNNEWTLYARNAITSCEQLDGMRLAIHSEGAVSTAMVKNYVESTCPGTEPTYLVIPGSPARLAALLADQIDASPLELTDAVTVDLEAADRFSLLTSLSKDLPELQTTSIYVNGDFAAENPGTVYAVVKAVLEQFRAIDGDAALLEKIAREHVGDALDLDTIGDAAAKYVELSMFPVDGGLTKENLEYSAKFFGPEGTGASTTVIPVDQFADLSFLEMALDELGS